MKITCSKNQFLYGVNTVSKAVSNKTTMDILQCILIEAYDDCIKLTANDTELGIETVIQGTIIEPGKIALEAKIFSEIIKKIPDNDVCIETDESGKTNIECEQIQCSIMGRKGDDFSHLPEIEKENKITLSQFNLKEVIRQTIFSVSDNENNKLMTGELLSIENNKMTVTSLDGHRISVRNIELQESYPKMVSNDYETKLTINKMELLRCLDRSTLFVKESDKKPIILKIENEQMNLMISSQIGSMKDQIAISKEGKDLVIGFNPKFLVDALRVIDEEEVTIYLINSIAPCIIRDEKSSYLYLILPINVSNSNV